MSERLSAALHHREELLDAIVSLEAAMATPAPGRAAEWRNGVRRRLADVRDRFEAHVDVTERTDGLYEEVVRETPRLAKSVDGLRNEHVEIRALITAAQEHLDSAIPSDEASWADGVRRECTELLGLLVRHRQRGADLLYSAYQFEVGGQG